MAMRLLANISVIIAILVAAPGLFEILLRKEFHVHTSGVIIISGTSSGIGRGACGYLAERHPGITYFCGVRKIEDAAGYPFTLENVDPIILDVTSDFDVDAAIAKVRESKKPLVGVLNNAGISKLGTVEFQDLDVFRSVFEVNVFGTYRLTQAALPLIRESQGRIVLVGSIGGCTPGYYMLAAYTSTKKAIESLADALRLEVQALGVSVSIIEPGFTKSNMTEKSKADVEAFRLDGEEARAYPHIISREAMEFSLKLLESAGGMDETCAAIENAFFGKYPKTRYLTERNGPIPSWLFVWIFEKLPDRMVDAIYSAVG